MPDAPSQIARGQGPEGALPLKEIPGIRGMVRHIQRIGTRECVVHLVAFDREQFHPSAYERAGIHVPDAIARSVPKRKAEFFFGRLAALQALHESGLTACQVGVGQQRQPLFPADVVGSITHSGALAAATVLPTATYNGVGIDIEDPFTADTLADVERSVLCAPEISLLRACTALPYPVLATSVFSAKESFYKAVFASVGRVFEYRALQLQAIDAQRCRLQFATTEHLACPWPLGKVCEIDFTRLTDGAVLTAFAW